MYVCVQLIFLFQWAVPGCQISTVSSPTLYHYLSIVKRNVVKAGPEGEPESLPGHGLHGRIGQTGGRTGDLIINEKYLTFKYTFHIYTKTNYKLFTSFSFRKDIRLRKYIVIRNLLNK